MGRSRRPVAVLVRGSTMLGVSDEFRCYCPGAIPGYGWSKEALDQALEWRPDAIIAQGTSSDIGPWYFGSSGRFTSSEAEEQDLELMIGAALNSEIPFVVSVGGAGTDEQLENSLRSIERIADRRAWHLKIGVATGEISKDYLRRKLRSGAEIKSLADSSRIADPLTTAVVDQAERIVAQMGPEVIQEVLSLDVDGVVVGRSLDAGLFAALPVLGGFDPAIAYGFGTLLNDGISAALPGAVDGCFGILRPDSFDLTPTALSERCTPESVLAAVMRERATLDFEPNPGGELDFRDIRLEQLDDLRTVRVSGFRWSPRPYTVKMEGVTRTGFRSIVIAGFRDPTNIENYEELLGRVRERVDEVLPFPSGSYVLDTISYGLNGVLADREPLARSRTPHEIGLVLDIVADTQEQAMEIARLARSTLLHTGYRGRKSTEGNVALPFSPAEIAVGPVYVWSIWHALPLADPLEPFQTEVRELGTNGASQ